MHSKTSPTRLKAQERRLEILRLRVAGKTLQEIADQLGVTTGRIYQLLKVSFQEFKDEEKELSAHYRR